MNFLCYDFCIQFTVLIVINIISWWRRSDQIRSWFHRIMWISNNFILSIDGFKVDIMCITSQSIIELINNFCDLDWLLIYIFMFLTICMNFIIDWISNHCMINTRVMNCIFIDIFKVIVFRLRIYRMSRCAAFYSRGFSRLHSLLVHWNLSSLLHLFPNYYYWYSHLCYVDQNYERKHFSTQLIQWKNYWNKPEFKIH
jgi:hypothetical protein